MVSAWEMTMKVVVVVMLMVGTSMMAHAFASPFPASSTSSSTRATASHPLFSIRSGATKDDATDEGTTTATATTTTEPPPPRPKVPVTVLSGFLGSGKTTLLKRLLENKEGLRVGVIVNDVAAVNIDSKLLLEQQQSQPRDDIQVLQLSNGCACCSLADELLASVAELFTVADMTDPTNDRRQPPYHHIVIELSGVSSPSAVRSNFQDAATWLKMPLMERVQLDTMVTVVDTTSFLSLLKHGRIVIGEDDQSGDDLSAADTSLSSETSPPQDDHEEEAWTKDLPPGLVEALKAGQDAYFGGEGTAHPLRDEPPSSTSQLSDLLVEQVEVADIVLLNKVDLLEDNHENPLDQMGRMERIIQALNPRATVYRTRFGQILSSASDETTTVTDSISDVERILASAGGLGAAASGVVDDHRDTIAAAMKQQRHQDDAPHQHSHEHSHDDDDDHHHHHHHDAEDSRTHQDHDHQDHLHSHHDHHHDDHHHHSHDDHHHDHEHDDAPVVVAHGGGIGTFVYQARRPFHPRRLASTVLRRLPVVKTATSMEADLNLEDADLGEEDSSSSSSSYLQLTDALSHVLRSKGFAWLAHSNLGAMYWSHAGSAFEMQCLGRWWATLPRDQWPPEAVNTILADFDNVNHKEESEKEETVGDRRQELVFIGPQMDNPSCRDCIRDALDSCLVNDEEWNNYHKHRQTESTLRTLFPNPLFIRTLG